MKFAVLGSGFGLYGYLPAIASLRHGVVLPQRYRQTFSSRPELAQFENSIEWQPDELSALQRASVAVIAKRPQDQHRWVEQALALENIQRLILEKPLAPTPQAAMTLQRELIDSGKKFRIGYTFGNLPWLSLVRDFAAANHKGHISIAWRFMAHHFQHDLLNWKRIDSSGGGALRFYGIQLIAALAQIGYRNVSGSNAAGLANGETTGWSTTFSGKSLADCSVTVDCRSSVTEFTVAATAQSALQAPLFESAGPFDAKPVTLASDGLDPRVGILRDIVLSLDEEAQMPSWYSAVLELWTMVEDKIGGRPES